MQQGLLTLGPALGDGLAVDVQPRACRSQRLGRGGDLGFGDGGGGPGLLGLSRRRRPALAQRGEAVTVGPGQGGLAARDGYLGLGARDLRFIQTQGGLELGQFGLGARDGGVEIAHVEPRQQLAGLDRLVVAEQHFRQRAGHAAGHRRHVAPDVGVLGRRVHLAVLPVQPAHDGQRHGADQHDAQSDPLAVHAHSPSGPSSAPR